MPYYAFNSGISLQANGEMLAGVSTLNLGNGAVTQTGSVATFTAPVFSISNGDTTIEGPSVLNVSGAGQTLTAVETPPSLVQKVTGLSETGNTGSISVTLPNAPTPGNVLIVALALATGRGFAGPTSGFTPMGNFFWYRVVQPGDGKTWNIASNLEGFTSTVGILMEFTSVGSMENVDGILGAVTDAAGDYSATVETAIGTLTLASFNTSGSTVFNTSNIVPAGATVLFQGEALIGGGGQVQELLLAFPATAASTDITFTNSADAGALVLNYTGLPPNPTNTQANLAIT
jgi:hypothetical protein